MNRERQIAVFEKNKSKHLREKPLARMQGVVTKIVAIIAFVISGATFYYNVVRQTDDLRIVLNGFPWLEAEPKDDVVYIKGPVDIILINDGNRSIAVLSVNLLIYDNVESGPGEGTQDKSLCAAPKVVDASLEPFVIKEREIVRKQGKTKMLPWTKATEREDGSVAFSIPQISDKFPEYRAELTLCFELATPSDADAYASVDLNPLIISKRGIITGGLAVGKTPYVIWHKVGSIFTSY
ncbi:MAG TPA: hypothetical protein VNZ48_12090 [Xanthobacteraceae bacterium]|jgi:hypothetical protein|nr:hypothetical protein [Xanthobacteraceae bacterium]